MLREEELNISPDQLDQLRKDQSSKRKGDKDFSFIQNRVPSPLNNNFLLSEEQSRHIRQPSEGFMSAANNLMNQDEFKYGYPYDQDLIEEENDAQGCSDDELDTSKISLFTDENQMMTQHQQPQYIIENLDQNLMILETVQMTDSNNDDFNYSESNYQNIASSSLGAIIQGMNSGSFIGFNNPNSNSNHHYNNNSRSSGARNLTSGRDSATPFNYDENSLMNLSQTPTSNAYLKSSMLPRDRIISSTKLNHNQNYQMVQIVEDNNGEEQDESMLPGSSLTFNQKILSNIRESIKQQDEWLHNTKANPMEMPLQINNDSKYFYKISDPSLYGIMQQDASDDIKLFSRGKQTDIKDDLSQQLIHLQNSNLQMLHTLQQDDQDSQEDEMQLIKKRLDFSRLSSLQNLSSHQAYLGGHQAPHSFMFQTYQSQMSNQSLGQETQHLSTIHGVEREQIAIPFEELLHENMKQISRNAKKDQFNTTKYVTRDEGIQVSCQEQERYSYDTINGIHQEAGISPPQRTKTSLNSNRPPLLRPQTQGLPVNAFPQKLTVNGNNQPIQLNCINIGKLEITSQYYQQKNSDNNKNQNPPSYANQENITASQGIYQAPPASRTTSTNSYTSSLIENQQALICNANTQKQLGKNKIQINPNSDTPREPSSLMIDDSYCNNPRNIVNIQNQIINNQQQIFTNQNFMMPFIDLQSLQGDQDFETDDDSRDQQNCGQKPTKFVKVKRRPKEKVEITKDKQPAGTSKSRKNPGDQKQQISKQNINFMSKTMIISKDKIQQAKSFNEQQQKQQQIIENIIMQNQMIKQKQAKAKKVKVISSSQTGLFLNPQQALNSGRSLPNSNQSSAQTSFLTAYNVKKGPVQKTTSKKNCGTSKDSSQIEEKKMKKMMKKNKSIARQHLQTIANNTQTISVVEITNQQEKEPKKQLSKCNTHRSVSRPKSGFHKQIDLNEQPLILNPNSNLGKKKHSQQVFLKNDCSNNKENIRPSSTNRHQTTKKSINLVGVGQPMNGRPEQIIQSFENIKLLNAQDLLNQIYNQQQKLSSKNFQTIFQSLDTSSNDIAKRVKTEDNISSNVAVHHNRDHIKSMQTFESHTDIDPYNMLTSLDSQRFQQPKRSHQQQMTNHEVYESLYKAAVAQNSSSTCNMMQKMQSPYNSKSMKNKFSTIKNKKCGELNMSNNNTGSSKILSSKVTQNTSKIGGAFNTGSNNINDDKDCKRCDELIHILKHATRYIAR
ncbi:UNKNOWN [Stylonychia lemnae]|uniref:Uncharacterized protein n=1 Tax=Stylonychia lemnae TaxID=5949 RepID=A0A077ZST4_STYLE|nr:UNKNOWN [Stylonychia lemnae]|eukprot:CDW72942.1 UNKNOWN [Stylonychia lemnae]